MDSDELLSNKITFSISLMQPKRDRRMSKNVVFRPVALRDPCKSEVARVLVVAIKYAKVL